MKGFIYKNEGFLMQKNDIRNFLKKFTLSTVLDGIKVGANFILFNKMILDSEKYPKCIIM